MPLRIALLTTAIALSGCSLFESHPDYSGPSDYAFTLTVGCFCPNIGPLRITVANNTVVDVQQLGPVDGGLDTIQEWIREQAMTLNELNELVDRAQREASDVTVEYDPVYGFPTDVYIDWIKEAVDDEVGYTVTEYSPA